MNSIKALVTVRFKHKRIGGLLAALHALTGWQWPKRLLFRLCVSLRVGKPEA